MQKKQLELMELERQLKEKQRHICQLQEKLKSKEDQGKMLTPFFSDCCQFFAKMAAQADSFGDQEAQEIQDFIGKYENSAQISQILYSQYYLKLELESEETNVQEICEKINDI